MGERFLSVTPSDRALEQAIVALKKGAYILKYGRRGKPKLCPFRLSTDERTLMWFCGNEEKKLQLSSVTSIVRGHGTRKLQPERECHSFSLIYMNNQAQCSLDLICKDKMQADSWFLGLKALISRCEDFRHPENQRVAQSCINSPSSFIRRKYNLGISKETTKMSQVRSVCASPVPSMISDPCFSDGLSLSSDSFYSRSSLSSTQNFPEGLAPYSPCMKTEEPKKNPKTITRFGAPVVLPREQSDPQRTKLNDVLIWGEGVENGVLGGGGDNMVNTVNGHRNQSQIDALLPKVLDSVSMLDVEKISLAGKHGVLVTKQGEVFCWGEGQSGRLGHSLSCPKEVESLHSLGSRVKSVSCSEYQTSALTFSGELYTWGDNTSGQGQSSRWLPRRISGVLDGITISKVACGEWHTAIVSTSGQLFTFGDGTFGVLGHGNYQSLTEPKQVDSLAGLRVKSVACGPWHTAAVVALITGPPKSSSPAGKMFTWGDVDKGRLGHGDHNSKLKPTCVVSLIDHDFVQVSCGRMLTVGLTSTGAVFTIGSSVHGQLGNPMARENSITLVQGKLKFEFVREIATGSYHVAVLTSKGSVYTWGKGANGQLGLGDTEDRSSPTLVEALRNRQVESITCGSGSTAAVCVHEPITCGLEQSGCRGCSTEFGFMKKRHNCYNCGLLFCSVCTSNKSKNACLAPNENKSFRVCDSCFKGLERSSLNSGQIVKIEDLTPRPLLIKTFSEETDDQYTGTPYKTGLDLNSCSSLMNQTPRWGQVSSPASFRKHCKEESSSSVDSRIPGRVNKNPQSVEKTTKRNGAKEVIKALTSRLHLMSPRAFMRKPTKAHVDTPQTSVTSVPCDIEVKDLIDPCESARVPTMHNDACVLGGDLRPSDEPVVTPIVSGQVNKVKQKHEWMEQYQPGVYITFIMLTTGQKGIKRVRFSRKVFKEREAEKWWEDNQQKVYDNYNVDGYINSY
ncbi:PH, RCC1 and FYVE domains-containing protein 1 isoform X1 [Lactuca sativa]|uniref:FYVE-type domain-containing protein n=1 Tax=Lactuca sativa TaxID=4236 RepID=A0A9R1W696_LACSA|nr:PH, RCC1 and FYVE domains-containing protein 1 isoform X1 [Lactuca sativa]KAJ0219170.1 hypothetical protein LSAT_V11C300127670 [Lactuca sativa]